MTVVTARSSHILKKRINRFFEATSSRKKVCEFISHIAAENDVLVFGGCIRDIALFGVKAFDSDIDLVFCGEQEELDELLSSYTKNKFGGYRLKIGTWDIDIWALRSTWAFKNQHIEFVASSSLLNTTITNWDSIFFSWCNKTLVYSKNYFKDLNDGYLDLVLPDNPNNLGCLTRIFRFYLMKQANIFSPKLRQYLINQLAIHSDKQILEYERKSYPNNIYLNEQSVVTIRNWIERRDNELIPTELAVVNKTKDMFRITNN